MTSLYGAEFFAGRSETVVRSAAVMVPLITQLLAPRSVLDLGCGQGEWVSAFHDRGVEAVGVDIADGATIHHDLTEPLDLDRNFDLVLCLETGEHLPDFASDVLVDSICRHSTAAVFSAATVGQQGIGHINCQPHRYWHDKFALRGYRCSDVIRPRLAREATVSPWYRNNTFIYEASA